MKLVTVGEMQELERRAEAAGVPTTQLMENAGLAFARSVRASLGGAADRHIVALIGSGNNGGDGLVAARHLADWGAAVTLFLTAPRRADDRNYRAVQDRVLPVYELAQPAFFDVLAETLASADAVLDAVLGTGRARPIASPLKDVLTTVRRAADRRKAMQIIALDLPTGLDADTGAADPATLNADRTVTLGYPKRGLTAFPGAGYTGALEVVDIGIPPGLDEAVPVDFLTLDDVRRWLPNRPAQANKGTFGRALVVAGSGNYIGAAVLACRGALRAGAGLVTLAAPQPLIRTVAGALAEATYLPLPATDTGDIARTAAAEVAAALPQYDALLVGCGLGLHPETRAFVEALLLDDLPLPERVVIDADALNTLAALPHWWQRLPTQAVLTPHPGELGRLLERSVAEVQADRIVTAQNAAHAWDKYIALKGAYTVIAAPDRKARVSPFANPALASAGTGDVLAGIIAGLLAQGATPYDAAAAGVFLHAAAGERWVRAHGDAGLAASDLPTLLPDVMRAIRSGG